MNSESKYIVIDNHIRKNVKTNNDNLEILLFDVNAADSERSIVSLTAHVYEETNRHPLPHEIDMAKAAIKRDLKNSWVYGLTEDQ